MARKVTLTLSITDEQGHTATQTMVENGNLSKAEAFAFHDYLAMENVKVLGAYKAVLAKGK